MQTRTMGPGAGWRWLVRGVNLGRNNPKALFGAAALMMVVAMVPSLLQSIAVLMVPQAALPVMLVSMVVMIVLLPLLVAGFLRVIHAAEQGRPTRALAIFDPFREAGTRGRTIALGLVLFVVYMALFVGVMLLAGGGIAEWYLEVLTATQAAGPDGTPELPPMPAGFGRLAALMLLVMMVNAGLYAIGFGQLALNDRGVGESLRDAVAGTLRNVLPLLVLVLVGLLAALAAILVIGLVVGLLVLLGTLLHPALGVVLALPIYLAFLVMLYVVMFGVMYFIWLDVCGPEGAEAAPAADSVVA